LKNYLASLESIDAEYFSCINRTKGLLKDIFLPAGCNINMSFTLEEFYQFKQMIRDYLNNKPPTDTPFKILKTGNNFSLN
jgi:hypothetical protein